MFHYRLGQSSLQFGRPGWGLSHHGGNAKSIEKRTSRDSDHPINRIRHRHHLPDNLNVLRAGLDGSVQLQHPTPIGRALPPSYEQCWRSFRSHVFNIHCAWTMCCWITTKHRKDVLGFFQRWSIAIFRIVSWPVCCLMMITYAYTKTAGRRYIRRNGSRSTLN